MTQTQWILEAVGLAVTALAIVGVVLNNHRRKACFVLWWISNAATACLHIHAGLWALTIRDVVFFALAVHGWYAWSRPEGREGQRSEVKGQSETEPAEVQLLREALCGAACKHRRLEKRIENATAREVQLACLVVEANDALQQALQQARDDKAMFERYLAAAADPQSEIDNRKSEIERTDDGNT